MFFPNGKARTGWRLSNYETHLGDFAQAVVDNTDMELNIVDYMDKSSYQTPTISTFTATATSTFTNKKRAH